MKRRLRGKGSEHSHSGKNIWITYVIFLLANMAFLKGLDNPSSDCQRSDLDLGHFSLGSPKISCKISHVYLKCVLFWELYPYILSDLLQSLGPPRGYHLPK